MTGEIQKAARSGGHGRFVRAVLTAATALVASCMLVASAAAHVQVNPTTAATDDAVKFEVLVPNESDASTVKVELAVPADVIPFSFEETPGWRRSLNKKPDGSIESIVWRGKLRADGFVRFAFLAGTPAAATDLVWKSIQNYDDGQVVRWIGSPASDNPAAVTVISPDVERQNAGGESAGGGHDHTAKSDEESGSEDQHSNLALAISLIALALAVVSLSVVVFRGRRH